MSLIHKTGANATVHTVEGSWVVAAGAGFPDSDPPNKPPPNGALFWRTDFVTLYYWDLATQAWLPVSLGGVASREFSKGGSIISPATSINVTLWQAPYACTVAGVRGYLEGSDSAATINARRNGVDAHLAVDLSLAEQTWTEAPAVQNTTYAIDDWLEIQIINVTDATLVAIQVDFVRT